MSTEHKHRETDRYTIVARFPIYGQGYCVINEQIVYEVVDPNGRLLRFTVDDHVVQERQHFDTIHDAVIHCLRHWKRVNPPHYPDADLWACPCRECTSLAYDATEDGEFHSLAWYRAETFPEHWPKVMKAT